MWEMMEMPPPPIDENDEIQDADAKVLFTPAVLSANDGISIGGISTVGENHRQEDTMPVPRKFVDSPAAEEKKFKWIQLKTPRISMPNFLRTLK